jgi:hypothetical protein
MKILRRKLKTSYIFLASLVLLFFACGTDQASNIEPTHTVKVQTEATSTAVPATPTATPEPTPVTHTTKPLPT